MTGKDNPIDRMSTRLFIIGTILIVTGFVDYFFGPLMDARGFSFIGLVLVVVGLLAKRRDAK